jgi:glycosyltransferase involved in cell wall biosynthesis
METQKPTQGILDVIVPVYNEELNIPILLDRLKVIEQQIRPEQTKVIFVDDHSIDSSLLLLKTACGASKNYQYLRLYRNSGNHKAILAGLEHSRGDCAV